MYCKNCGTFLNDGAKFCPNCGTPVGTSVPAAPQTGAQQPRYQAPRPYVEKKNKVGLAGFIFSIIALCSGMFTFCITSGLAIILSAIGMAQSKKCNRWNKLATAGLVIGIIALVLGIIIYAVP